MDKRFENFNLDKQILKALYNLGYNEPSEVQAKVIPLLLKKENIIVKSKTGSGKTASYAIPICNMIDVQNNNIQGLIVVPTRELAIQVKEEISNIGRLKKIRCSAIFGKQSMKEQIAELKQRVHIVVATPGRIIDHITRNTINLENIKYFVIDEADKMLNKGFVEDMEFMFKNTPKDSVKGLFSATIDSNMENICSKYMENRVSIEIKNDETLNNKQITEKIIRVQDKEKYNALKNIIYSQAPKSLIIFCNTKDKVSKIYRNLKEDGFLVTQLHGDMSQEKRNFTIKDFKNGKFNMLVSTDVAGRGIHIDDISLVINFDVPRDKENYVHRIGRTGRQKSFGKSITIVCKKDERFLDEIQDYIGYKIDEIDKIDEDKISSGKIKLKENAKNILKNRKTRNEEKKVHSEITRLYINAGKKKKIRVIDIVGALNNLDQINNEDIGVIEVQELCSYVDILNHKGEIILRKYKEINIKKKMAVIKKDNR